LKNAADGKKGMTKVEKNDDIFKRSRKIIFQGGDPVSGENNKVL